ncbi:MAG: hypothetical protein ACREEP_04435 [Dongiaceae bacterium]
MRRFAIVLLKRTCVARSSMPSLHVRTAIVLALIAAGLALWMAASHDSRALPAEAVRNALGWGSFMLYGLYYLAAPAASAGLARLRYFVALSGVAVEAIGIAGTEWNNPFFDPFRIFGALIVAGGFVLFGIIVFGTRAVRAA